MASYDHINWFRVPTRFDGETLHIELQAEQKHAWLAYFEPYSRERHAWLIEQALNRAGTQLLATGKSVEKLCKAKRAPEARALVLKTLKEVESDPVRIAANNCYTTQKEDFDTLAGPKLANDAENYARWIADPALAEQEMTDGDICK